MTTSVVSFDPSLARLVKGDTLEPHQQKTRPDFKTACDFRHQVMLKHPFLSDFHSRAEHLYAGLLEGNSSIISYIPQPFRLRVRGRFYTPDCYVLSNSSPRRVIELKPGGKMREDLQIPVKQYLAQFGMCFEVISNESVYERMIEAENWLEIVRILHQARDLFTTDAEQDVFEIFHQRGPCTLEDFIDSGDRDRTYSHEIALFRLMHQGHVVGELTDQPLDYNTRVSLCA